MAELTLLGANAMPGVAGSSPDRFTNVLNRGDMIEASLPHSWMGGTGDHALELRHKLLTRLSPKL